MSEGGGSSRGGGGGHKRPRSPEAPSMELDSESPSPPPRGIGSCSREQQDPKQPQQQSKALRGSGECFGVVLIWVQFDVKARGSQGLKFSLVLFSGVPASCFSGFRRESQSVPSVLRKRRLIGFSCLFVGIC